MPAGAKLFVYSQDKKHYIGAFTEINNKGTKDKIQGFATGLIRGDTTILEYYLPKGIAEEGIISISRVVHGYKPILLPEYGYGHVVSNPIGQSGHCQVNINCSEGANRQAYYTIDEKGRGGGSPRPLFFGETGVVPPPASSLAVPGGCGTRSRALLFYPFRAQIYFFYIFFKKLLTFRNKYVKFRYIRMLCNRN